jgi:hypothetical protein
MSKNICLERQLFAIFWTFFCRNYVSILGVVILPICVFLWSHAVPKEKGTKMSIFEFYTFAHLKRRL